MDLPDLKDLAKVLDLCRKKGVSSITIGELKIELGHEPVKMNSRSQREDAQPEYDPADPWANFPAGTLDPEQLQYYSAGGIPGKEPWLNKGEPE